MFDAPPLPEGFLARPVAHRGLHGLGRPENSLAAIEAGITAGYGIEIDVQPAACGTPMVFHDATLDRMTRRRGRISERSVASLTATPLKRGPHTIPTLERVLETIAGRVPLIVEIKDQDGSMGPNVGRLEEAVCAMLSRYGGPAAVMSFNPHSVAACRDRAPDLPRGLVTCAFRRVLWRKLSKETRRSLAAMEALGALDAAFISHAHRDLDSISVRAARASGHAILCWTVRSPGDEATARRVADQVTFEKYRPARRSVDAAEIGPT